MTIETVLMLPGDLAAARTAALQAVRAAGYSVASDMPGRIEFTTANKGLFSTFGKTLRYLGQIRLAPANDDQTRCAISVRLDWQAAQELLVELAVFTGVLPLAIWVESLRAGTHAATFFCVLLIWVGGLIVFSVGNGFAAKVVKNVQDHARRAAGGSPSFRSDDDRARRD